jgi:hypothetical protein
MGMRIMAIWPKVERWDVEGKCRWEWEGREHSAPRAAGANESKEIME